MDNKPVHCLSTFPPKKSLVTRHGKDRRGRLVRHRIHRPTIVSIYNKGMGGTDLFDQFSSYYRTSFRGYKWPLRLFSHFFIASCINAHILWKKTMKGRNLLPPNHTQLSFMEKLIKQWCCGQVGDEFQEEASDASSISADDETPPEVTLANTTRKKLNKNWEIRKSGFHYPTCIRDEQHGMLPNDYGRRDVRRCCVVCGKRGRIKCIPCNAYVCADGSGNENCFYKLHTLQYI